MTDEQINRLVAEKICGWHVRACGGVGCRPGAVQWEMFPSYATDRNAITEMEEAIEKAGKWKEYVIELRLDSMKSPAGDWELCWLFRRASPRQCAEAALRAFGLWEE